MGERRDSGHSRWTIVGILCAVAFVLYVDRVNITVTARQIASQFHLSDQALGEVLGSFLFGYAFGLVPGGWLADRFGAHRVLVVAGLSWAATTLFTGAIQSQMFGHPVNTAALLISSRFVLGLCEACAYPTFNRALANWMRRSERARASGLIHAGSGLGGAFTPVLIALIVSRFGWRESFFLSAILTFVVTIVWWRVAADRPSPQPAEGEEKRVERPDLAWYGRLLRSREAYLLCLSEFLYGVAGFIFLSWFYVYFTEVRGAGKIYAAVLYALPYVGMTVGAPVGGILCDWFFKNWGSPWGRKIVPLVAITLSGFFGIIAPAIRNNTVSASMFAVAAGLQFVAAPAFWATVIDVTRRGTGVLGGCMNGAGNLGAALATVTFPWLMARVGWDRALEVAGATALLSGILWWLIDSSRQIDGKIECLDQTLVR